MALEEQMTQDQPMAPVEGRDQREANMTEAEEQDLAIGVLLGERFLQEGGFDVISEALKGSSDPSQPIGQFFITLIKKLMEDMPADVQLSPRIFLAKNGWVEQMMDMVIDELKIDIKIADKAEIYIADTISQMASQSAQQQAAPPQGAAPAQPPLPQGAV